MILLVIRGIYYYNSPCDLPWLSELSVWACPNQVTQMAYFVNLIAFLKSSIKLQRNTAESDPAVKVR